MWYIFVFSFLSNSHKVVGMHFVRYFSDGDAFAILYESSDTLGSYLSRWTIKIFIFASHTIAPLGSVLFENWQDLGSASDSPKTERRCDGAVGVQRSCQDKQSSSPSSNRHEPDAQTLIIWYCLSGRVYTMCMFGLAGAPRQVNVSSCAPHPPSMTTPAKNEKFGQQTGNWEDLHVIEALSETKQRRVDRFGAGGEWVTERGGGEEMFYPLYLKAFLAGRRAPDLFHHRQWISFISLLRSPFPGPCVYVYVCVYALQVCVCVRFSCLCVSLCLPEWTNEHTEGPAACLSIFHCSCHLNNQIFCAAPQALNLQSYLFLFPNSQTLCPILGESGLGKSTLINSLFLTDLYSKDYPGPSQRIKKTVQVRTLQMLQHCKVVTFSSTDTTKLKMYKFQCW